MDTNVEVVPTASAEDATREKRRVWKNIIVITFSFFFIFSSMLSLLRLQSTLNQVEGMGVITLSILFATRVISSMFVPKLMTHFIGHRWTIVVSLLGYIVYIAANGNAAWSTMIMASVCVGLSGAPLWTAQCSYFTIIAQHYQRLTGQTAQHVVSRFFGFFFLFYKTCESQHTYSAQLNAEQVAQLSQRDRAAV